MSDKYVFVEYSTNLNETINQPIQLMQRLKYTCFDVSTRYIVFGASSGGLYVFTRWPCIFLKLIPNNEGSIVEIAISPDEKTIAFATSKGLVMLLDQCFSDDGYSNYQQFAEHEGHLVTALKWQNSEIYCGDNTGKVSIITVANLLTKAIFQTPSATLMTLDSAIVQIDSYSKYLLISTTTRTFLCDTEKEHYRQIGKKLRDGQFGACFLFNYEKTANTSDIRIVCSRPGARLWRADFDATVTCTHHFKNIASQKPASIVHLENNRDAHLSLTDYSSSAYDLPETFNFGKLLGVAQKFILTYANDVLYIIDPQNATLLFWTNYYSNIRDVKVANNYLYIQSENFHIETVFISTLEDLILETLFKKQYFFCAELCVHFSEDVLSLIDTSNRIHLVTVLEEKLADVECKDLLDKMSPLLEKIREFSKARIEGQKLEGGIVVVDNVHFAENKFYEQAKGEQPMPDTLQVLKELSSTVTDKLAEGSKSIKEKLQFLEDRVKKVTFDEPVEQNELLPKIEPLNIQAASLKCTETFDGVDIPNIFKILRKHYELNKINANVETQRLKDLFGSRDICSVIELLQSFVESSLVAAEECKEVQAWCYMQFLKHLIRNQIEMESKIFDYTQNAFIAVNSNTKTGCKCGYPLPEARNTSPQFLDTGCKICRYLHEQNKPLTEITNKVSYMWKYALKEPKSPKNLNKILALIVQYSDEDLFTSFSDKFTYDVWDEATKFLVKLNKGVCLNCDAKIDTKGAIAWSDFSSLMLQSLGGISTVKLLVRYSKWIPSGELNNSFYQSCIFSTALDNHRQNYRKEAVSLAKEMFSEEGMSLQMSELIEKYLHRKHMKGVSLNSVAVPVVKNYVDLCGFCELPLNIEILGETDRLRCDHSFHRICLIHNNRICCICKIAFD